KYYGMIAGKQSGARFIIKDPINVAHKAILQLNDIFMASIELLKNERMTDIRRGRITMRQL
ncbi:hypothetical protein K7432_017867, partial [Basidiobolus ranarum]